VTRAGERGVNELVRVALERSWHRDSQIHGEAHWLAVAATGLDLAAETGGDAEVIFAFGLLHDTRREGDSHDPEHGPRAATFARELHGEKVLLLDDRRLELLCLALELHAEGQVSADSTVGTCWDADRLHLGRQTPGFRIDPDLLSTDAARTPQALASAVERRQGPLDWASLASALVPTPPG
jgi:uncharacterized protein